MAKEKQYWLMKTEPSVYSIDDLKREKKTCWEGVRNYQARNFMRDQMKTGDLILFYHSNSEPPGIYGMAKVCRNAYADSSAWDKKSKYYDEKSSQENPCWFMVDVEFVEKFPHPVSLEELKTNLKTKDMLVAKKGMRLSVQPIEKKHFHFIQRLIHQ